ncbi:MAG: chemotaxis protein CheB [Rhodanobacter sp.]|jgi:two-component system chemotaxis response regulator CheB/chemosensory pili system protein ChpB (putative protein-glutamate methylesterase)|nr:chemotaxis protein CheB [Rhodanobacter sp.]
MSELAPAVALLFDDTKLGGQLREALSERGARIVHEGCVSSLNRELMLQLDADVLVVNLDDSAADALDELYALIDGDRPRVVFNDAQASRALEGWDRARWARHLAVKVLEAGDIDPPRPEDARGVDAPDAALVTTAPVETEVGEAPFEPSAEVDSVVSEDVGALPAETDVSEPVPPESPVPQDTGEAHAIDSSAESENLAAELEALLASGELPEEEEEASGPGLRSWDGDEPPPLHDGNFGAAPVVEDAPPEDTGAAASSDDVRQAEASPSAAGAPAFQLDHLQLAPLVDPSVATIPAELIDQIPTAAFVEPTRAPDGWALVDNDDTAMEAAGHDLGDTPDADAFGINKLSAAEFLAPDVEQVGQDVQPLMSLQLVSMEEAVAPQAFQPVSEMLLDDTGSALSKLVVLGAAAAGMESVQTFLAALPATMRLTFLHTQHSGRATAEPLVEALAGHCPLSVRMAEHNGRARFGEVLLVPPGQQVRVRRDGVIELQADDGGTEQSPSIDASLTMAANIFGRDALAIVFAGQGTDAVAGAQAIHDRGGQVWVESSSGEHFSDMVSGIFAERLVSFSGTSLELAAHLVEVFP